MTSPGLDWVPLASQLAGELVLPGSSGYEAVRTPAMARFHDVRPAGIVRCATSADVAAAIAFGRRAGLPMSIRCGGHSVAGRSVTEGLVIDVTPMDKVRVYGSVATVGAGARLGDLYSALYKHGVTIPAGCGPSVGIAGLTLGGGIGTLGRRYGLTCDRLRRAQVVLADSQLVECDQEHHADLFWALRGAGGGNFGVVTSLVFDTVPAPVTTVFQLLWPFAHAAELVGAWQAWAPFAPDDIDATLRLAVGTDAELAQVELIGAVLGSENDAESRLDAFVSSAPASPASARYWQLAYPEAKRQLDAIDQHRQVSTRAATRGEPGHLYAKSEFFRRPLNEQSIQSVVEVFSPRAPGARARAREVAFMPWGGAYNAVAPDATAFPHRSELFLVQHLLEVDPRAADADREACQHWLSRSWAALHPSGSGGVYPNFPDPDLPASGPAYYRENYQRLRHVKARYDPDNVFRFHQSLPPLRS